MAATATSPPADFVPGEAEVKGLKDFLIQYNTLSEQCFNDCIRDFTSREVSKKEENCANNCLNKYLKMTQRMALRFQEYQMIQSETMGPLQNVK